MDFSLMAVDVSGGFENPVMQVSVFIWAAVLATFLTVVFSLIVSRWQRVGCGVAIALFGCISSPFVNRLVGMWLYQLSAKPGVSVGFIGGPPFWLSTLFALAITGASALAIGRISPKSHA